MKIRPAYQYYFTLCYTKGKKKQFLQKIWAKWESDLSAVRLKWDPPVVCKITSCYCPSQGVGIGREGGVKNDRGIEGRDREGV